MATIFPNTSDFKPRTFTDFSLQTDNDVSLSTKTLTGEIFTTPTDTIYTRLSKGYTRTYNPNTDTLYNALGSAYSGWITGSNAGDNCDFTYEIFKEVPSPTYIQEVSDTNNNFRLITKWTGSENPDGGLELSDETIGRGFIAPYNGLYTFNITAEGETKNISNEDRKGGYLNLKLIKYLQSNLNNPNVPTDPQIIFETLPTPIILTSSQYNFKQVPLTTKLKDYVDTEEYSIFNIFYHPVPLTSFAQNNANLPTKIVNVNGIPSTRVPIPHSGSYTFDIKVGGQASVETQLTTPTGYQGDYTTENETFVVKLQLNISRQNSSTVDTIELGSQEINIGGVNFTDPSPSPQTFTKSELFDLIEPFSISDLELDLDTGDAIYLSINVLASSNDTHREYYGQGIGFLVRLTSEFFRVSSDSFLKLKNYEAYNQNDRSVYFNLSEDNIEIPLREGDAVTFGLRLRGIRKINAPDTTGIGGPLVPGTFEEGHQNIQSIKLYSSSLYHPGTNFKVNQALNNPFLSGQYSGQPASKGDKGHYQPIYGSFYVDLSEVEAIESHPVKVQIPLYGIDKFSPNETLFTNSSNRLNPTSRRFLNNSIEINLTTTQNNSTNILGIDQLTSTNATHGCNFFHWGDGYSSMFYNSALITRFDRIGSGFTDENINDLSESLNEDIINISDIITVDFGEGSLFGIYEGGADIDTSNIPEGALYSPRIVMLKEARLTNQGRAVIVQPAKPITTESPYFGTFPPQLSEYEELGQKCSPTPLRHQIVRMLQRKLGWEVYSINAGDNEMPLIVTNGNAISDALWWKNWAGGYSQVQNPGFKRYEFFHPQNKEIEFVFQPPPDVNGELPPPLLANVSRPTHLRTLLNDGVATYISAENFAEAYNSVVFTWAQTVYGQEGDTLTDVNFHQLPYEVVEDIAQNTHYMYNPRYIDLDAYPRNRPPTITPYLDQVRLQGFDNGNPITGNPCWKTASNSPANFFPINTVYDPTGDPYTSTIWGGGNRMGPDTLHNVQNYYEVPHTGYYNIAYMFDMVVMSYGGDMSNTGNGYPSSRGWQFPNEVMFSSQIYPLPNAGDPLLGGDNYQGSIEWWQETQGNAYYESYPALCNNTLYGVLKRIPAQGYPTAPSTQVIPGDIAGVPRVIITSSLGRVSDFGARIGDQYFTQAGYHMIAGFVDEYGRSEMYNWTMTFNNELALQADYNYNLVEQWANVDVNTWGYASNYQMGLNELFGSMLMQPNWHAYLNDGSSIILEFNPNWVFDDADGGDVYLDGSIPIYISSQDGASLTSDVLLPMLGTYGDPTEELNQTAMDLDQWWENFNNYQAAVAGELGDQEITEGFIDAGTFTREYWSISDDYVFTDSEGNSVYGYDPENGINPLTEFLSEQFFGIGIRDLDSGWYVNGEWDSSYWDGTNYEDLIEAAQTSEGAAQELFEYQAFIAAASELNIYTDGNGNFWNGFNEEWTIEDIEAWIIDQWPEVTQARHYSFKNPVDAQKEEIAALARQDRLVSATNAWAQQWGAQAAWAHGQMTTIYNRLDLGTYNPGALGSAIVADNVNTYLVKGDKVFFEIALGPMMDSYGNLPWGQDTFPDPNTPISGSHKRVSSIGGAFIMENSIASITPVKDYNSTFIPNLEFIVTRNNNNIVKGTYKHY